MTRWLLAAMVAAATVAAEQPAKSVTFSRDIAPLAYRYCAPCHHAGGAAPFPLVSYADLKKRARQIAAVTRRRYMPPWLPEPGKGEFEDERRLTDEQIRLFEAWAAAGAPEGDPPGAPQAPQFTTGWELGQPDLVVQLPKAYTLAASGPDVFRNFVLPVPITSARYVRAVELQPGNARTVHHANILVDRSGFGRARDGKDGAIGFPGMDVTIESAAFDPDSHFLFWKPGTPASAAPPDMAWRLDPGTDLIVNLHLQPSGKPERVQPSIGLYFTDRAPTKFPMLIQLEHDGAIDIPPGERNFIVTDEFKLPIDADALAVYPHAHYIGRDLQAYATLPDGTTRWLIHIPDWDINWQAVYRFKSPVFLPKGAVIRMRYRYDNSADNPRNPSRPPVRVTTGDRSVDEMGHLWLQLLPRPGQTPGDARLLLQEALMRRRIEKYPGDYVAHYNLGALYEAQGRHAEAIAHLRMAVRTRPGDAAAHNALGAALLASGDVENAIYELRAAIAARPDEPGAQYNLAHALVARGSTTEAIALLRQIVDRHPRDYAARSDLGAALAMSGATDEGLEQLREAVRLKPDYFSARYSLGRALAVAGHLDAAAAELRESLRLSPADADAHTELGAVLLALGRTAAALSEFQAAVRANPDQADAQQSLGRLLSLRGDLEGGIEHLRAAEQLRPSDPDVLNDLGGALARAGRFEEAQAYFERALRLNPRHAPAQRNLDLVREQLARKR
jgi:Flp pilus assembly protein TadD